MFCFFFSNFNIRKDTYGVFSEPVDPNEVSNLVMFLREREKQKKTNADALSFRTCILRFMYLCSYQITMR